MILKNTVTPTATMIGYDTDQAKQLVLEMNEIIKTINRRQRKDPDSHETTRLGYAVMVSGQAVVATMLGLPCNFIEVSDATESKGSSLFSLGANGTRAVLAHWTTRGKPYKTFYSALTAYIITMMSGCITQELLFHDVNDEDVAESDDAKAIDDALFMLATCKVADINPREEPEGEMRVNRFEHQAAFAKLSHRLETMTFDIVHRHFLKIIAVSKTLLNSGYVSGAEVAALCQVPYVEPRGTVH